MLRLTFRLLMTATCLFFAAAPALAQQRGPSLPAQVHGQVRYAQGGAPAFNILVRIEKFSGGVVAQETTDRSGKFHFSGLTREQFNVRIHTPGFKDVQQWVELNTNLSQYVMLTLEADESGAKPAPDHAGGVIDANVLPDAQEEFTKGRAALLDNGRMEEGIAHLEKAISIYPNFLEAYLLLGTAYMDARRLDKAENELRKAIEINSKSPEAYFALGEAYRQQKKYTEAVKILRDGLKLDHRLWYGHYTLGRVYWEMGDYVKAGPQIGLSIQLKPDFPEARLLAGNILLRAHKPDDALLEFQEYLRLAPKGAFSGQAQELVRKIKRALADKKR
jgi:tetratricopeptide (TPR) repeat protein